MKCVLRQRRLALMTSHVARDLKRSSDVYRGQDVIGESCFERKYESNINYCLSIVVFRKLPGRLLFYSLPLRSIPLAPCGPLRLRVMVGAGTRMLAMMSIDLITSRDSNKLIHSPPPSRSPPNTSPHSRHTEHSSPHRNKRFHRKKF
jgi:hypothetical protein